MFGARSFEEGGVFVTWDQPSIASDEFQSQIDWLMARLEDIKADEPASYNRSLVEYGRLDAPNSPAYIVVTDESRISGLITMLIVSFVGDPSNPTLLVLVGYPESIPTRSALEKDIAIIAQIASCYRSGD